METVTKPKGNPNFGKKKVDLKKEYRFQLVDDHSKMKPRDLKTGEMMDNPYPPVYFIPNEGIAIDPETKERRAYRYIHSHPSVWVDEQVKPEPSKTQLLDAKNTIMFEKGFLRVPANNPNLLKAVQLADIYEGNEYKLNPVPPVYRMLDEDKEFEATMDVADRAYEAEKAVREMKVSELMPLAMVFGINFEDEDDEPRIRKQLILKAKQAPDALLKHLIDPRNKVKWVITQGLKKGLIKAEQGVISFVDGVAVLNVDTEGNVAEQVASSYMSKDKKATDLYERLSLSLK